MPTNPRRNDSSEDSLDSWGAADQPHRNDSSEDSLDLPGAANEGARSDSSEDSSERPDLEATVFRRFFGRFVATR
jgi:hypothetical protein